MAVVGRVLLIQKGDYSGSAVYNSLDWVRNNGAAWVCKVDGTQGIAPPTLPTTSNANWTLLAADGSVTGAVAWLNVTGKPFETVDSSDFVIDDNNELNIKRGTFGTMKIVSGGTTTNLEASGDATFEIDAGTNVTISADDSSNPKKITINSSGGGGGSSTFAGLSDTDINNPQADQIVQYKNVGGSMKLQNVAMPQGGHTMVDNTPLNDMIDEIANATTSNQKVVSAYGVQKWSNSDVKNILVSVSRGDTGLGVWNDGWKTESPAVRTGWMWHSELYRVLSDGNGNAVTDIKVDPVFVTADDEVVSCYAMRIDDDYTLNGVHGGCVAFKFNGEISSANGATVGVQLTHLRTEDFTGTKIS